MKLIKFISTVSLSLLAGFIAESSYAGSDSVNINVTGRVIASPCTTINGGSDSLSVSLGETIQATTLSKPDSGTPKVTFDLPLTGCPLGTLNVKATFSGTADTTSPTMWKNTAASPAANTAVELSTQADSTILGNGSTLTVPVSDGNATFKMQARAYSSAGSVTPGDIDSTIIVAFEYQ
ncbi:type 1 fimbrial protein [Enterobacter dykesii]|uniref:fimbrial protein n=1 Tax=Enterobacter dykesii TaxID=2797506 RepID=UPI001BE0C60F|nr:fimbrial protein [Enterobacter dykesii]MBT1713642.1 type 1 fimbrial protein [Enterobacter dykesii]